VPPETKEEIQLGPPAVRKTKGQQHCGGGESEGLKNSEKPKTAIGHQTRHRAVAAKVGRLCGEKGHIVNHTLTEESGQTLIGRNIPTMGMSGENKANSEVSNRQAGEEKKRPKKGLDHFSLLRGPLEAGPRWLGEGENLKQKKLP